MTAPYRWRTYAPGIPPPGDLPSAAAAAPVKENLVRTVSPVDLGGTPAFLKVHRARSAWGRLRQRLHPKSLAEAEVARTLRARGIDAPEPLAAGWASDGSESALLTRAVPDALPLHDAGPCLPPRERRAVARALGRLLADLHRAHLWHPDLHAENLLLARGPDAGPWLLVSDLPSARFLPFLPERRVLENLAMLAASTPFLSGTDRLRALQAYAGGRLPGREGLKRWVRRILEARDRIWHRHWRSRTRRCTRTTGRFVRRREGPFEVVALREIPEGAVARALEAVRAGAGTPVKRDRGSRVTRGVPLGGFTACVKELPPRGPADRLREAAGLGRAHRAWIRANALRERACATALPLAWARDGATGWILSEDLSKRGLELDRWVAARWKRLPRPARRRFLEGMARSLGRMDERAAWPGDAKACNFLVLERPDGGWDFPLVDVDAVRALRPDFLDLGRALMQLHLSVPKALSGRERARFLRDYLGRRGRGDWQEVARTVLKLAGPARILYQSDAGDVEETWP